MTLILAPELDRLRERRGPDNGMRKSSLLFIGVGLLLLVLAWFGNVVLDTGPPP
jgi:hypothetical protein